MPHWGAGMGRDWNTQAAQLTAPNTGASWKYNASINQAAETSSETSQGDAFPALSLTILTRLLLGVRLATRLPSSSSSSAWLLSLALPDHLPAQLPVCLLVIHLFVVIF